MGLRFKVWCVIYKLIHIFYKIKKLQADFEHFSSVVHIYVFPQFKLQTHFKKTKT
jgi:hypothetical protein